MELAFLEDAEILSKPVLDYQLVWSEGRYLIRLSLCNHKQSLHAEFTLLRGDGAEAEALAEGLALEFIARVKKAAGIPL